MTLAEFFSTAGQTVLIACAVVGAFVALQGLTAWKRQLKGHTEYDLARRLLVGLLRYKDAIQAARHPAMWGHEMPSPPSEEAANMDDGQIRYYGTARAYEARWDRVNEERRNLYPDILEGEALWGAEFKTLFRRPHELEVELQMTIQRHLEVINPDTHETRRKSLSDIAQRRRDILYDSLEEGGDEFARDLTGAMEAIETFLRPKLAS